ncbi:TolC family protein [Spirochaetota bacterium]
MKNKFLLAFLISFVFNSLNGTIMAKESEIAKKTVKKDDTIKSNLKDISKKTVLKLNAGRVIRYLLKNNYDVRLILLDYKGTSSALKGYLSKYDVNLFGNVNYSYKETPNPSEAMFQGQRVSMFNSGIGATKLFSTGTSLTATYNSIYMNNDGITFDPSSIPGYTGGQMGGKSYTTGIKVEVVQELLKNSFGMVERMKEKTFTNTERIRKETAKMQLAALLVQGIIGYWNVAIAEESVKTASENLSSTINIRNLVARKMRLGLSEREEIFDWNGKVLQSRNNFENAKKRHFDAKLNVIKSLNLSPTIDIEVGETFNRSEPVITLARATKDAFIRRIDWNNQRITLRNSELEYRIASNEELPSLKLKGSYGTTDYARKYYNTYNTVNNEFSVGLEVTYPLGNTDASVKMRDARLKLLKSRLELKKLEKTIKDEIISVIKQCETDYKIYLQSKNSAKFARNYYYQVYRKFKRGRYSAVQLKMALDGRSLARSAELQSLVNYNISLLRRDLARNYIFKKYKIDIDRILKIVSN